MANDAEEHESGTITPAGRFARMEAALGRIEDKLDAKADMAIVEALAMRVGAIESHGTPEAVEALTIARQVQQRMTDNETGRSISPFAQQFLDQFRTMSADIAALKADEAIRKSNADTLEKNVKEAAEARYNSLRNLVAVATIIQSTIIIVVTLLSLFHII